MTKTYTPQEVALVVLKKTAELMADLKKTNTAHEVEIGQDPATGSVTPGQDKSNGQPQGQSNSQSSGQSQSPSNSEAPKKKKKLNPDGTESEEYEDRELLDQHNESKHGEPKNENSAFKGASPAVQQEKNQAQTSAGQKPTEAQKPEQKEAEGEKPKTKTNFPSFAKSEDLEKAQVDAGKSIKQKVAARSERNNRYENNSRSMSPKEGGKKGMKVVGHVPNDSKGTHSPTGASQEYGHGGESHAGNAVRAKKTGEAKQIHSHMISESKGSKKPNLPKSEEMGSDNKVKNIKIKSTKLKSFLEKKMAKREGI